jgi:hypothetical protein
VYATVGRKCPKNHRKFFSKRAPPFTLTFVEMNVVSLYY